MFHVGQLVICIDDRSSGGYPDTAGVCSPDLDGLKRGTVYTVRDVYPHRYGPVIRLVEIVRPVRSGDLHEVGYAAPRFRPLNDSKLSILRQIAASPRQRIGEDA